MKHYIIRKTNGFTNFENTIVKFDILRCYHQNTNAKSARHISLC